MAIADNVAAEIRRIIAAELQPVYEVVQEIRDLLRERPLGAPNGAAKSLSLKEKLLLAIAKTGDRGIGLAALARHSQALDAAKRRDLLNDLQSEGRVEIKQEWSGRGQTKTVIIARNARG